MLQRPHGAKRGDNKGRQEGMPQMGGVGRGGGGGGEGGSPETLAVSGMPAPSRLPTRMVDAVAMPNGKDRKRKTDSVSKAVCASTSTVPARFPSCLIS